MLYFLIFSHILNNVLVTNKKKSEDLKFKVVILILVIQLKIFVLISFEYFKTLF